LRYSKESEMKSQLLNGRWAVLFLITAFALCITPAIPAQACDQDEEDPNGGYGPYNRPVFLILSLDGEFLPECSCECEYYSLTRSVCCCCVCDCDDETDTVIIRIGTFIAGDEVEDARFELLDEIDLPAGVEYSDLGGNQATIIGSFKNSFHLVLPDGGEIPDAVQEAFFLASPFLDEMPAFPEPTTEELAQFIYARAVELNPALEEQVSAEEIMPYIFATDVELSGPEGDVACEAEGDLFPHDPDEDPLFDFDFVIDTDDELDVELVSRYLDVDIKPGSDPNSVNVGSKGVLPVAILSAYDKIDPYDIDLESIELGGVVLDKYSFEDVDDDGDVDLMLHFKMSELTDGGALDEDTTELTLTALAYAEEIPVEGTDSVRIVPPKGKKNKK